MGDHEPIWRPLERAFRAAVAFFGHLVLSLLLVAAIWLGEQSLLLLWNDVPLKLFGLYPFGWLFHAADVGVFVVFNVWGLIEAQRKLRG